MNSLRQNVESMIRTFMTIKLFYQKYDYIVKLSTIGMNFNMCDHN